MSGDAIPSTRPYLIRALHEWCTDNGYTPYVAVAVDGSVQVPRGFVRDGEIVLNTSYEATSHLQLGNEFIEFKARFGGVPRDVMVPVDRVLAIYARENGQGMAFPPPVSDGLQDQDVEEPGGNVTRLQVVPSLRDVELSAAEPGDDDEPPPPPPTGGRRPALKIVK